MVPRKYRVFLWLAPIILLNWIGIVTIKPTGPATISLGFFFGSVFAHAALAAAWMVLGPLRFIYRAPLSLIWLMMLAVGVWLNIAINGGPQGAALIFAGCSFGQWTLVVASLAITRTIFGFKLQHSDEDQPDALERQFQFGIRQLLMVTSIVAVVLGIGRASMPFLSQHLEFPGGRETSIFTFLGIAAVLVTLPLMIATLMQRWAILGVAITLSLIGLATYWELSLMRVLSIGGPDTRDFVAINSATTLIMLLLLVVIRFNGYCLVSNRGTAVV
jgi:hypothetical protein